MIIISATSSVLSAASLAFWLIAQGSDKAFQQTQILSANSVDRASGLSFM